MTKNKASKLIWKLNRACLRKKSLTQLQAENIIDLFASRGTLLFYYKCELCARYHLTSREPKVYNDAECYKII